MKPEIWQRQWPDKPGTYWFYGWEFGIRSNHPPELRLVRVFQAKDAPIYVSERHIMSREEMVGLWMPASLPETPHEEDLRRDLTNE